MSWLEMFFGMTTLAGIVVSIVLYYKAREEARKYEADKARWAELRTAAHWQLQALHHACNRIENIMLDPDRPDLGVIEVARGIRDNVDALMAQLLAKVTVFPWARVPIVHPVTGEELGLLDGTVHRYKSDPAQEYPITRLGHYRPPDQSSESGAKPTVPGPDLPGGSNEARRDASSGP